jgi:hypothetical protein
MEDMREVRWCSSCEKVGRDPTRYVEVCYSTKRGSGVLYFEADDHVVQGRNGKRSRPPTLGWFRSRPTAMITTGDP